MFAAVVTMFFLYTYGMVNLAAFVESFDENPLFRPSFHFYHRSPALTGALGCGVTAFLNNPSAAVSFQHHCEEAMANLATTLLVSSSGEADMFV